MARLRAVLVAAVFICLSATLLPAQVATATTRSRVRDVEIDATAVVMPEVAATTRRTTVRELAHLVERMAAAPVPFLLFLVSVFAGLAFCAIAFRSRRQKRGVRTRAPPSSLRVA